MPKLAHPAPLDSLYRTTHAMTSALTATTINKVYVLNAITLADSALELVPTAAPNVTSDGCSPQPFANQVAPMLSTSMHLQAASPVTPTAQFALEHRNVLPAKKVSSSTEEFALLHAQMVSSLTLTLVHAMRVTLPAQHARMPLSATATPVPQTSCNTRQLV
jgi:hypothetical protein